MAQLPEMESPSACQEYLVEAQEDSTSVDLASTSSTAMTTTTTTTTTPTEDAARQSVNGDLRENSVMVHERINENSENGELEERQSSDNFCLEKEEKKENEKEEEKKEMENQKVEDKVNEDKEDSIEELLQEPEESIKTVGPQTHDLDDEETRLEEPVCISRKRSVESDFLPIDEEVKKVGLEISEEQAMQLKNDIRRLSPVLVSTRERTLGEISLISESCSFKDDIDGKTMSKSSNDSHDELSQENEIPVTKDRAEKDVDEAKQEAIAKVIASSPAECTSCDGTLEITSDREEKKTVECDSQEKIFDVDSSLSSGCDDFKSTESNQHNNVSDIGSAPDVSIEKCVDETTSIAVSSPVCRRLSVVLNRIDVDVINPKDDVVEKDPLYSERKRNLEEEYSASDKTPSKKQRWHNDTSPMTRSRTSELMEPVRSPNNLVLKKCKVMLERISDEKQSQSVKADETTTSQKLERERSAPVSVIGQLEEDEEVVLAGPSVSGKRDQVFNELDSSETMPSSPEEMSEPAMDVVEGVDTETETETGSDSSEVSPIVNIRELRDVDIASDQPCPEAEPLCCVETMAPIMTRLETERPETYTEDSAESLALTTGARDDVRSDGSDSGLGNEIPGDPGPTPAPESDSETSFLDRLPDDILSDKEKGMNQLDNFATSSGTTEIPEQPPMTSFRTLPAKSNLKRRLIDCMENDESRSNTEEPMKKKRNIHFDAVTVYYFPRAQGFTCVPSQGGSTLGMSATHTHAERFSLSEHAAEQRRIHRARLAQLRSERNCAINCVTETASSSEDPSDDTDEEPSDNEDLDIDSYYFLQPVPTSQRRALLRAAGVRRIDAVEKDECRDIRASREHCGCGCKGYCDPESCPCSRANVKCQVDRPGFPCGCTRDGCANSSGRIEFNPIRVRTHFIHTLMRLELEKKQREEEGSGDHDQTDNQGQSNRNGSLRNIGSLGSVMDTVGNGDVCTIPGPRSGNGSGGGFTTLHYETSHDGGIVTAGCQPEVPGTREDSLDLYAISDDCYPSEDAVDGSQSIVQRKLHPEFSQAFQSFSPGGTQSPGGNGGGMSFQQSSYQDYGSPYAGLPSTSRVPQFQQPQFQSSAPPNPAAFSHYGPYGAAQTTASAGLQSNCTAQMHQVPPPGQQQQQHSSYETAVFAQDDATSTAQYTNLTNSVQPMNASVVQQMQNKLEPFSELLSGRYSYYGEMHEPQQHHGTYGAHGTTSKIAEIVEPGQVAGEQHSENTSEDCDENFGEIIKKSMVETVSA